MGQAPRSLAWPDTECLKEGISSHMTNFNPVVNGVVVVCSVVGFVGILFGAYLVLAALPELPRYIRIKRM